MLTNLALAVALSLAPHAQLPAIHQTTLAWGPCPQDLAKAGAECAKVAVPLDYKQPAGRTIQIAISRVKAANTAQRKGVLLANPGGPGGPGLAFAASLSPAMKRVATQYDLIGFDPRFIGDSTPITCGTGQVWQLSPGFERAGFEKMATQMRSIARRCKARADLLPYATTRNVARDMDAIRAALGEAKLSYYGVSYGADLGAVYTQMFPDRVDRFVLDSSTDPDATQYELFQRTGPRSEAGLDEWAAWTARRDYGLGRTAAQVRATVTRLLDHAARTPIHVGASTIDEHLLPVVLSQFLQQQDDNDALAQTVRDLAGAAAGKKVTPNPAFAELLQMLSMSGPAADRWTAGQLAVLCDDGGWPAGGWPRGPQQYWRDIQRSRATQPIFGALANSITPCAYWPLRPHQAGTRIDNRVPVLMLQARRDINTVYDGVHRKLAGSRLVTADLRAHGVYTRRADGYPPSSCVERLVNAYLAGGPLPAADIDCGKENR